MIALVHWSCAPDTWLVTLTYFSPIMTPFWKNRFFLITRKIINRFEWCWALWKVWLGAQICYITLTHEKFEGQGHIPIWRKKCFFSLKKFVCAKSQKRLGPCGCYSSMIVLVHWSCAPDTWLVTLTYIFKVREFSIFTFFHYLEGQNS